MTAKRGIYWSQTSNRISETEPLIVTHTPRIPLISNGTMTRIVPSTFSGLHAPSLDQDVIDNRDWMAKGVKLTMPVLAIGGAKSFGPMMATAMRAAATDVTEAVVPDSDHWLMEEQPDATIALVDNFIEK